LYTSVACAVDSSVKNPLQKKETQHMNIVLQVCIDFLNSQIWNEIMLELNVTLQVLPHSQLIFPSKIWFFEIYLYFQQ